MESTSCWRKSRRPEGLGPNRVWFSSQKVDLSFRFSEAQWLDVECSQSQQCLHYKRLCCSLPSTCWPCASMSALPRLSSAQTSQWRNAQTTQREALGGREAGEERVRQWLMRRLIVWQFLTLNFNLAHKQHIGQRWSDLSTMDTDMYYLGTGC